MAAAALARLRSGDLPGWDEETYGRIPEVLFDVAARVLDKLQCDKEPEITPSLDGELDITWHKAPDLALSLDAGEFVFNLNCGTSVCDSWEDKADVQQCAKQVVDAIQPLFNEVVGNAEGVPNHRTPQPPPRNRGVNVPEDFRKWAAERGFDDAIALSRDRDEFGFGKYKQRLMTKDGRDSIEDAIDELGDFFHYAHKAKMNGEDMSRLRALAVVVLAVVKE